LVLFFLLASLSEDGFLRYDGFADQALAAIRTLDLNRSLVPLVEPLGLNRFQYQLDKVPLLR
jgi:hypothetical protein